MRFTSNSFLRTTLILVVWNIILTGALSFPNPAMAQSKGANVIFILDGSASMWGEMESQKKIAVAKERMTELVQELTNINIGLIVYGHRRKADCNDIELMVPMGSSDPNTIIEQIQSISPKGKTPITKAIEMAAKQLETIEEETAVVLVSDGLETCAGDPCVYVRGLKDKGIKFKMDVVGFDVKSEERKQLECIAKAGEGRYFTAKNTMQLKQALTEVKKEVVKKAAVITKAEPEPKVAVEPGLKLRAVLKEGGEPVTKGMNWEVYKAEKDINGDRERVASSKQAESIFHLSAGRYFIEAKYGNANAISSMEVEVPPGELKEIIVNLNAGHLKLNAVLKEGAEPVTKGMNWWYLYKAEKDINGHRKKIASSNQAEPLFYLSAGRYFIEAKYGNANAISSMEVEVPPGELTEIMMNLNAGHLKLNAVLKEGAEPVTEGMNWWYVYKAEKDINGYREKVASSNQVEPLFYLSAGRYFIKAKYGNANAISSMEVEVTPGELTETNMNLKAGYLRLHAVLKEGGKPVPKDMRWRLYEAEKDINGHRELIISEKGPAPLNKLSAGRYVIVAKHGKAASSMEVEVTAGELRESTINLNAGYLRMHAVLKESGKRVMNRRMRWTVYKAEKDINGKREKIDFSTASEPLFKLSDGRYFIHAKHRKAASSMEVEVTAGELKETTMNFSQAE